MRLVGANLCVRPLFVAMFALVVKLFFNNLYKNNFNVEANIHSQQTGLAAIKWGYSIMINNTQKESVLIIKD
jgi:hypothetical protein